MSFSLICTHLESSYPANFYGHEEFTVLLSAIMVSYRIARNHCETLSGLEYINLCTHTYLYVYTPTLSHTHMHTYTLLTKEEEKEDAKRTKEKNFWKNIWNSLSLWQPEYNSFPLQNSFERHYEQKWATKRFLQLSDSLCLF